MSDAFDRRITRAQDLAIKYPESAKLLDFYCQLALLQKTVFMDFRSNKVTEIRALAIYLPALIQLVQSSGPEPLVRFAKQHLQNLAAGEELLIAHWQGNPEDAEGRFFTRVLLQPYAEDLAGRNAANLEAAGATCPFCGARPSVGVLRSEGDGAKRSLICSRCATEWAYRRLICPNCGEEQKDKLPVYIAAEIDHVRVEACDTCQTYIKSVDLTRNGLAVPEVDEVATVTLNLWAEEHGYVKLEPNILGM